MRVFEGNLVSPQGRFAVCVSRFNSFITEQLLSGALDALRRHGVADDDVDVYRCPGTFELPQVVRRCAERRLRRGGRLGCVIRGGTPHFEYVAGEVSKGVGQMALSAPCAVTFGVLTCDTVEQAIDRAGVKAGNKGADAAVACIEMANLLAGPPSGQGEEEGPMSGRRQARERALQALYQLELSGAAPRRTRRSSRPGPPATTRAPGTKRSSRFALELVQGVREKLTAIDELIGKHSHHWRLDRMSRIDRNVLRLGVYELKFRDDIPKKVTLNEAVELGKKFGGEQSSAFINGLLDKLAAGAGQVVTVATREIGLEGLDGSGGRRRSASSSAPTSGPWPGRAGFVDWRLTAGSRAGSWRASSPAPSRSCCCCPADGLIPCPRIFVVGAGPLKALDADRLKELLELAAGTLEEGRGRVGGALAAARSRLRSTTPPAPSWCATTSSRATVTVA